VESGKLAREIKDGKKKEKQTSEKPKNRWDTKTADTHQGV